MKPITNNHLIWHVWDDGLDDELNADERPLETHENPDVIKNKIEFNNKHHTWQLYNTQGNK